MCRARSARTIPQAKGSSHAPLRMLTCWPCSAIQTRSTSKEALSRWATGGMFSTFSEPMLLLPPMWTAYNASGVDGWDRRRLGFKASFPTYPHRYFPSLGVDSLSFREAHGYLPTYRRRPGAPRIGARRDDDSWRDAGRSRRDR